MNIRSRWLLEASGSVYSIEQFVKPRLKFISIRNKKAGRDAKPIADLNGIRSITQTQRKYGKRTKNRNIPGKNRTAGLFALRNSRNARRGLFQRLWAG